MKYKGALFFDYDGTLSDEKNGIPVPTEVTKRALNELAEKGYLIVLATGRPKCLIPETGINFGGYVLSNGSYAEVGGERIFSEYMDYESEKKIIEAMRQRNLVFYVETPEFCYASDWEDERGVKQRDNFNMPDEAFKKLDDLVQIPRTGKFQVIYDTEADIEGLEEEFPEFVFDRHRKFPSSDIIARGMSKAIGARAVCESLGIDSSNVYAFGDGTNDYDMLKFAGHGVALGEHAPILDEVAEFVTDTVVNEGIYKALVRLNLL